LLPLLLLWRRGRRLPWRRRRLLLLLPAGRGLHRIGGRTHIARRLGSWLQGPGAASRGVERQLFRIGLVGTLLLPFLAALLELCPRLRSTR
jgi:hypothetical protein